LYTHLSSFFEQIWRCLQRASQHNNCNDMITRLYNIMKQLAPARVEKRQREQHNRERSQRRRLDKWSCGRQCFELGFVKVGCGIALLSDLFRSRRRGERSHGNLAAHTSRADSFFIYVSDT